jgi:5-methylcytosine-specific restriction endonuclease McrA
MSDSDRHTSMMTLAARDGWICYYCGINLIPIDRENEFCSLVDGTWVVREGYTFAELEHKTSRNKGGGNEIENLALSCGPCNRSKGKKTEPEFRERRAQRADLSLPMLTASRRSLMRWFRSWGSCLR